MTLRVCVLALKMFFILMEQTNGEIILQLLHGAFCVDSPIMFLKQTACGHSSIAAH